MLVTPFMKALSDVVGQEVDIDGEGGLAFSLEGGNLLLQWNEKSDSFVAYVEVGPLLGWNDAAVCRELLAANFLLLETQGAALSYDEVNNRVALNRNIPVQGLEPENFIQILNNLLDMADIWRKNLKAIMARQEEAALANAVRLRELSGESMEEAEESSFLLRV